MEVRAKKALGQHFLTDQSVARSIVAALSVSDVQDTLEIGPGMGVLSQYLLAREDIRLKMVEVDGESVVYLRNHFPGIEGKLLQADYLKLDMRKVFPSSYKVIGNFPYNISSQIFFKILEDKDLVPEVVCMIQKEVADRMQVGPGTKDYGALSLAVQYYAQPYIVANVPPNCFMPRPKVGSAVIRLTRHEKPPVEVEDEKLMFSIIRASFNQRRKTMANGLNNSGELNLPKEVIQKVIETLGKGPSVRGEALTLQEFSMLSNTIHQYLMEEI